MIRQANVSSNPFLNFTKDFHELVRGQLERGLRCTISYDPDRIVPEGDGYRFGDPQRPVTAYLRFKPLGPISEIPLQSSSGTMAFAGTTLQGIGPTLKGEFMVPADADWIEIWFRFVDQQGRNVYDSDYGKNFKFRFLAEDVDITHASVAHDAASPLDKLWCRVEASPSVSAIRVRYRVLNTHPPTDRKVVPLEKSGEAASGRIVWELRDESVPHRAVVQFDVEYWVDGERFKENNQGSYFLATETE